MGVLVLVRHIRHVSLPADETWTLQWRSTIDDREGSSEPVLGDRLVLCMVNPMTLIWFADNYMRTHSNVRVRLPSALLITTVDRALALNPMQYRWAWLAASIKPRSSR